MWTSLIVTLALAAPPAPNGWLQRDLDHVRDLGVAGVVADVRVGERHLTARSGVADRTTRRPVPRAPQIRIASATKAFTAAVVLQLAGEGRLDLDDTVDKWLPGLVDGNGHDGRKITIRRLLQMTSGLADPSDEDNPGSATVEGFLRHRLRALGEREYVALSLKRPPLFAPGAGWNYANVNYLLAGMIIQRVTGQGWERQVTDRVIVPLGLSDTYAPGGNPFIAGPHLNGYRQFAKNGRLVDTTVADQSGTGAASGLISTPADLSRFFTALVTGTVVRRAQLAEMQRTVPLNAFYRKLLPGARYGLGLMWFPLTCGKGYWTHWGDALGYSTRGGVTADGERAVIIHANTNGDPLQARFHQGIHPLVDRALCGR